MESYTNPLNNTLPPLDLRAGMKLKWSRNGEDGKTSAQHILELNCLDVLMFNLGEQRGFRIKTQETSLPIEVLRFAYIIPIQILINQIILCTSWVIDGCLLRECLVLKEGPLTRYIMIGNLKIVS